MVRSARSQPANVGSHVLIRVTGLTLVRGPVAVGVVRCAILEINVSS